MELEKLLCQLNNKQEKTLKDLVKRIEKLEEENKGKRRRNRNKRKADFIPQKTFNN